VEDWAEIRRLHRREGLGIKTIASTLGISPNTVRAAIESDGPPRYQRKPAGSAVDAFEDAIRAQLELVPTMLATVIAERVGWTRGITVFKERVAELRPAYSLSIRLRGRTMSPATSRSATCGSRRSSCRSGSGRPVAPRSCRC
jgi:transposase